MQCFRTPLIALTLATFLTGCAAATSDVPKTCPGVRDYSSAQLNRAADELDRLGPASELSEFMTDYRTLRAQARDCWER